ncbi:MAG: TMEM165/GDT1 family protein [Neisseriaceae bacterium]|nr:TMEM165/GDT1 family protein [Neisseriaceae bacterium]
MDSFIYSTGIVALAEIGDKTQLMSIILAARFKKPWPIIAGIFAATLLNHGAAAWLGQLTAHLLTPEIMRYVLAISFLGMAIWSLIPDKIDEDICTKAKTGIFITTFIAFFLAEMGDKTQIATIALAAKYQDFVWVTMGTTLGMMIANVPAVLLGEKMAQKISVPLMHKIVAVLFFGLAIVTFFY